ncbi:hotdog domain-containing protein [Sphaerisporangium sp. NPDC051011]|uniref:acyl-CoA thioesterase n=1 Tax=Sphaerisporangium sp. NPDC051011 TaxID=3155792 RepID=UPI0033D06C93
MDTDAAGIYHNTVVTRFVEAAEADLMRRHGITGYFPVAPRVRYEVDFDQPLWFEQVVTTVVELENIGRSSITFAFEVWGHAFRGRSRARAASGRYTCVHVQGMHEDGTPHSVPWPRQWVEALRTPVPGPPGITDG